MKTINYARLVSIFIIGGLILFVTGMVEKKTGLILQIETGIELVETYLQSGKVLPGDLKRPATALKILLLEENTPYPLHPDIFSNMFHILGRIMPAERIPSEHRAGWEMYLYYLKFLKKQSKYNLYYILSGILAVIATVLLCSMTRFSIAFLISRAAFLAGRVGLMLSGIIVLAAWMLIKQKYWIGTWGMVFSGFFGFMLLGIFALKIHDPNYHVWNRFLKTMVFPLVYSLLSIAGTLPYNIL